MGDYLLLIFVHFVQGRDGAVLFFNPLQRQEEENPIEIRKKGKNRPYLLPFLGENERKRGGGSIRLVVVVV